MSSRTAPPLTLREFQREAVDALAAAGLDALAKEQAAGPDRRKVARRIGASLLQAPTGAGKTAMLAAAAARVCAEAPVVWFWFAPFAGVIAQTFAAIRRAAPALRPREPSSDRALASTRAGDVLVTTWASVAARSKDSRKLRQDDEGTPSLDTLALALRDGGFRIGCIVDESHHTLRPGSQAFAFLDTVLDPDLLWLASATPDDARVLAVQAALDIDRFNRVSVSRRRAVEARLNKRTVKAVSFTAEGPSAKLIDLAEVALRAAVAHTWALRTALKEGGFPVPPLLLVQAASDGWTPKRVKDFLVETLKVPEAAIAVHTADEPDPDVQAAAADDRTQVLVFKMAVATGFDAPRAFCLAALRPVADANFGQQVVGRIMRVHPLLQPRTDLPEALDTGYVFLADAAGQQGLQQAAETIRKLSDAIATVTDTLSVLRVGVDENGVLTAMSPDGQQGFLLEPPSVPAPTQCAFATAAVPEEATRPPQPAHDPNAGLFFPGFAETAPEILVPLDGVDPGSPAAPTLRMGAMTRRAPARFRYDLRTDLGAPERLQTERKPSDPEGLLRAMIMQVRFSEGDLLRAGQTMGLVQKTETDLFDPARARTTEQQAEISFSFARQNAWKLRRVSDYFPIEDVDRLLCERLAAALVAQHQTPLARRELRRALDVILVNDPQLLRGALRRAMANMAECVDAEKLPDAMESDVQLSPSSLNLYGAMPHGLNGWENAFARWLDRQDGTVLWWLRNVQRGGEPNAWGAGIVLPDTGMMFYPDFVVGVAGRKTPQGVLLAETKARTETEDSARKSRTEHRVYGNALMVRYDETSAQFMEVVFNSAIGRNADAGWLRAERLLQ